MKLVPMQGTDVVTNKPGRLEGGMESHYNYLKYKNQCTGEI